jgi:hypothetical protein
MSYTPVRISKLSVNQLRKLKKGEKVIIKKGNDQTLNLSKEQATKFERKSKAGSGLTIILDPYQQDELKGKHSSNESDTMLACRDLELDQEGEGLKDFVGKIKKAKIGKKIIGFAKDTKLVKKIGNALIDRAVKTIAGSGVDSGVDSGIVPEPAKKKRGRPKKPDGGALFPAGYNTGGQIMSTGSVTSEVAKKKRGRPKKGGAMFPAGV